MDYFGQGTCAAVFFPKSTTHVYMPTLSVPFISFTFWNPKGSQGLHLLPNRKGCRFCHRMGLGLEAPPNPATWGLVETLWLRTCQEKLSCSLRILLGWNWMRELWSHTLRSEDIARILLQEKIRITNTDFKDRIVVRVFWKILSNWLQKGWARWNNGQQTVHESISLHTNQH